MSVQKLVPQKRAGPSFPLSGRSQTALRVKLSGQVVPNVFKSYRDFSVVFLACLLIYFLLTLYHGPLNAVLQTLLYCAPWRACINLEFFALCSALCSNGMVR